jgi:anti-anti-sigma factor
MGIDIKKMGTVDVIVPRGPLAEDDAETFIAQVEKRLEAASARFVLDMTDVSFLDSRGIEGIVETADALRSRGGRLRLAATPATCREVLELTGHADRVDFFDDTQSAVRSFL